MFSVSRLLRKQSVINKNNLQRINPLNECETVYIQKNNLNNPLNECEKTIKKPSYNKKWNKFTE